MLSFVSMLIFVLSAWNKIGIKFSTWVFGASCVNYNLIYRQKFLMHRTFVRIYTYTCLNIHKQTPWKLFHLNFSIKFFQERKKKLANYFISLAQFMQMRHLSIEEFHLCSFEINPMSSVFLLDEQITFLHAYCDIICFSSLGAFGLQLRTIVIKSS